MYDYCIGIGSFLECYSVAFLYLREGSRDIVELFLL